MEIIIDCAIAIPKRKSKRMANLDAYLIRLEQVGQSFHFPSTTKQMGRLLKYRQSKGQYQGMEFTTRTEILSGIRGCRIWRVK